MKHLANTRQVGGTHYASSNGVQHWDMIDEYNVGYLEACASKYLTRWRKKDGVQALEKAAHFMQKLYERRASMSYAELVRRMPQVPMQIVSEFCRANGLTEAEHRVMGYILCWQSTSTIDLARRELEALATGAQDEPDAEATIGYVNQDR